MLVNSKKVIIKIIERDSSTAKILGKAEKLVEVDSHFHVSRWAMTLTTQENSEKYCLQEGKGQPSWESRVSPL